MKLYYWPKTRAFRALWMLKRTRAAEVRTGAPGQGRPARRGHRCDGRMRCVSSASRVEGWVTPCVIRGFIHN
jgi:hypothetical protein